MQCQSNTIYVHANLIFVVRLKLRNEDYQKINVTGHFKPTNRLFTLLFRFWKGVVLKHQTWDRQNGEVQQQQLGRGARCDRQHRRGSRLPHRSV